jgi:hypothetical protein
MNYYSSGILDSRGSGKLHGHSVWSSLAAHQHRCHTNIISELETALCGTFLASIMHIMLSAKESGKKTLKNTA